MDDVLPRDLNIQALTIPQTWAGIIARLAGEKGPRQAVSREC